MCRYCTHVTQIYELRYGTDLGRIIQPFECLVGTQTQVRSMHM